VIFTHDFDQFISSDHRGTWLYKYVNIAANCGITLQATILKACRNLP
jgi:hypothetical protein